MNPAHQPVPAMAHDHFREWIPLGVSGDLDADEQTQLDAHRAVCPECQAQWRQMEQARSALHAAWPFPHSQVMPMPGALRQRIDRAVLAAVSISANRHVKPSLYRVVWRHLQHPAVAAVLALAAGLGIWFGIPAPDPQLPAPSSAIQPPRVNTPDLSSGATISDLTHIGSDHIRTQRDRNHLHSLEVPNAATMGTIRQAVPGEDFSDHDDFKVPKGAVVPENGDDQFGQF